MIALPPLLAGAVKDTTAELGAGAALTPVGGPGTVAGVTASEAVDELPAPTELVAKTVKVYGVPLASSCTKIGEPAPLVVNDPVDEITV